MVCAPVRRDCLTCTMISSVDLAYYGVSRANDLEYVDCDTRGGGGVNFQSVIQGRTSLR